MKEKNASREPLAKRIERWIFGGQDAAFFKKHSDEISGHNMHVISAAISVMTALLLVFSLFGLNSGGSRAMRMTYLVSFAVSLLLHCLFQYYLKKKTDHAVLMFCVVAEIIFAFLLLVGPVFDSNTQACYIPLYFGLAFLLPIMPMHQMLLMQFINLGLFAVIGFIFKTPEMAKFDLINAGTCFFAGAALGHGILRGRLTEIDVFSKYRESSERELDKALKMVSTDSLTGVGSRASYESTEALIDERLRSGISKPFALLVADVNCLKETNDTFGHEEGDKLLVESARLLKAVFAHSNVYRIGGDEFCVLVSVGGDYEHRDVLYKQVREAVSNKNGTTLFAFGVSDYRQRKDWRMADVFERADSEMYINKNAEKTNRNRR